MALLEVRKLAKHYALRRPAPWRPAPIVRAVDDVSFSVESGEVFALVGETGSGKSTIARLVMRLVDPTAGSIRIGGTDLTAMDAGALRGERRHLQMIFQDPFSSLNPRKTVRQTIETPLVVHQIGDAASRAKSVATLLDQVGLDPTYGDRYPHQLSGGQRQRVAIARAIALRPRLVVADEPVSSLDVSTRAQILNLLQDLREELGLTYLLISHDLTIVRHVADTTGVLYLGKMMEIGPTSKLFRQPLHPYTQALIDSNPVRHPRLRRPRSLLTGELPSAVNPPTGCRFHTRCPHAKPQCQTWEPHPEEAGPGHTVACHFWREIQTRRPAQGVTSTALAVAPAESATQASDGGAPGENS